MTPSPTVTVDHGAVKVAVCQRCSWRIASPILSQVWTAAARHMRADHADLAGGRKALRAALMAGAREHHAYRLPHGTTDHVARRGDDGPVVDRPRTDRVAVGITQPSGRGRATRRRS